MTEFSDGLFFWCRGWGHIFKNRNLLAITIIPSLLALAFAGGFLWLMWMYLDMWVHLLVEGVFGVTGAGVLYSLVYYPLLVGAGLVVFFGTLYVTFILHAFVSVPFYSMLAEATLRNLGRPVQSGWPSLGRLFRLSAIKAILLMMLGLLLFVFSFVPFLNVAAMAGGLLIMAFDCLDYSFDCLGLGLRKRFRYLLKQRGQWVGMAAGLALTLLVPGLTLLITPGAVVGGALILKEQE